MLAVYMIHTGTKEEQASSFARQAGLAANSKHTATFSQKTAFRTSNHQEPLPGPVLSGTRVVIGVLSCGAVELYQCIVELQRRPKKDVTSRILFITPPVSSSSVYVREFWCMLRKDGVLETTTFVVIARLPDRRRHSPCYRSTAVSYGTRKNQNIGAPSR